MIIITKGSRCAPLNNNVYIYIYSNGSITTGKFGSAESVTSASGTSSVKLGKYSPSDPDSLGRTLRHVGWS